MTTPTGLSSPPAGCRESQIPLPRNQQLRPPQGDEALVHSDVGAKALRPGQVKADTDPGESQRGLWLAGGRGCTRGGRGQGAAHTLAS